MVRPKFTKNTFCDEQCFICKHDDCILPDGMLTRQEQRKRYMEDYRAKTKESSKKYQRDYRMEKKRNRKAG